MFLAVFQQIRQKQKTGAPTHVKGIFGNHPLGMFLFETLTF
jgi:hypothetical protein